MWPIFDLHPAIRLCYRYTRMAFESIDSHHDDPNLGTSSSPWKGTTHMSTNSINLSTTDMSDAILACSMVGSGVSADSSVRNGFRVIADTLGTGMSALETGRLFGMTGSDQSVKTRMTLVGAVIRLASVVPADATDDGFTRIITQVNYLSALSMKPASTVASFVKDNPKVGTFNEVADLLANLTGEGAKGRGGNTDKTPKTLDSETIAVLKRIDRMAADYDTDVFSILSTLADMAEAALDATAVADEAADEAALAS